MRGDLFHPAIVGDKSDYLALLVHHKKGPILAEANGGQRELVRPLSAEVLNRDVV